MERDESRYIECIITYRLCGTAKLVGFLPDRRRVHHLKAVREYREQERRHKADVASVHAAKRRARSELGKKKKDPRNLTAQPPRVHYFESVAVPLCSRVSGKGGIVDILSIG